MSGRLDPDTFRKAMELFARELRRHRDEIDSLNVYPVPDGDTGTNMLMTQEAVVASIEPLDQAGGRQLGAAVSRAALMGARGNSGVILSQVLRGLCERLPERGSFTPRELAQALQHASTEADRAVTRPVDGTILSVLRDSARAAGEAAAGSIGGQDMARVLQAALDEARISLERTTDQLDHLKRAGVVDAGAKGMVLLLDALLAAVNGCPPAEPVGPMGPVRRTSESAAADPGSRREVQYLLEADDDAVPSLRRELDEMGDSLVVVGGGGLFNVHVHTDRSDDAIEAGGRAGRVRDVRVTDLGPQTVDCLAGQARAVRLAEQACALVAVAQGEGLSGTLRSLGAAVVSADLAAATSPTDLAVTVGAAPADEVVVLLSDAAPLAAAERLAGASRKHVLVVHTRSVAALLSAASVFNPQATLEQNVKVIDDAVDGCRAGELRRADRDLGHRVGESAEESWMGLAGGAEVASGGSPESVAIDLVRHLAGPSSEVVTLILGADATRDEQLGIEAGIRRSFPELELQVVQGDQPGSSFLIGVE